MKDLGRVAKALEKADQVAEKAPSNSGALLPSRAPPPRMRMAERKQALAQRKQAWKELDGVMKALRYLAER